jgi:hypothetical protein
MGQVGRANRDYERALGLVNQPSGHFIATEFWRFWVVHLWVENFLESFITILVARIFVLLGVEHITLNTIYLDVILDSAGGILGVRNAVDRSGTLLPANIIPKNTGHIRGAALVSGRSTFPRVDGIRNLTCTRNHPAL